MLLGAIRRNRQVIEENRRRIEDTWAYRPVDHIPFVVMLEENPGGYSLHDRIKDPVKQLEFCKASVLKTVERVPYDYIPFLLPEVGNIVIPTAFGAKVTFPDNPEELPIVEKPIIERIEDVYELKIPDPHKDGLMPEALDRVRYFARETDFEIPLALVNVQGPMNTAFKLMDSSTFYFALYDNPEAVTHVLKLLAETYITFVNALIEAAGGTGNITSTNHHPVWCPPRRKAYICDDMAATISPRDFVRFNRVANSYIYQQFGGGLIHNCGPHPSVDVYLDHTPRLGGLTTSWTYGKENLEGIKRAFKRRGLVYFYLYNLLMDGNEVIEAYKETIEILAPDVAAIFVMGQQNIPEDHFTEWYDEMYQLSCEYAAKLSQATR